MQAVKLPNGKVSRVGLNDLLVTRVDLELEEMFGLSREALVSLLVERAIGASALSGVTYRVTGHFGTALTFEVRGKLERRPEIQEIDINALEEVEFEATVTRVGYGVRRFRLSARTEQDAIEVADDDAGNHLYSEHYSEYKVDVCRVSQGNFAI